MENLVNNNNIHLTINYPKELDNIVIPKFILQPIVENSIIYEVGPGPGALTRGLLMSGAHKVVAVEMDHRCIDALNDVSVAYPGKLEVHEGDALKMDELELIGNNNGKNTPYQPITVF